MKIHFILTCWPQLVHIQYGLLSHKGCPLTAGHSASQASILASSNFPLTFSPLPLLSPVCRGETALNACQALPFPTRADSSTWHACNIVVVARVARVIVVVVHAVTESWPGCLYLDAVRQLPAEVALRSSLQPAAIGLLFADCAVQRLRLGH